MERKMWSCRTSLTTSTSVAALFLILMCGNSGVALADVDLLRPAPETALTAEVTLQTAKSENEAVHSEVDSADSASAQAPIPAEIFDAADEMKKLLIAAAGAGLL